MAKREVKKLRGIYEREPDSGIWWIRYKADGVDHREKAGTRKAASDLLAIRKAAILHGQKLPANMRARGVTIADIGKTAIEWYTEHGKRDLRAFTGRMNAIMDALGTRRASEVTPAVIDKWLAAHDEWTPATKNRYKTVLSKAFQLALVDGKVSSNPARLVSSRAENNKRIRYLLADEEAKLRAAIQKLSPDQMPALDVALHTGMRKGEQFSLEWDQVDFDRKRIYLSMTKNGSDREIPMSKTCYEVLDALRKKHKNDNNHVFQQSRYKEALQDPKKWFENALTEAKVSGFRWHDLRHTFCSRLVMKGVDIRTVQELAGHKSITMTARYSHLAPEHNQAAIEMLD